MWGGGVVRKKKMTQVQKISGVTASKSQKISLHIDTMK